MYNVYFYTLYTHCHKLQNFFHTFVCLLKEIGKPVTFTIILLRKNYIYTHTLTHTYIHTHNALISQTATYKAFNIYNAF